MQHQKRCPFDCHLNITLVMFGLCSWTRMEFHISGPADTMVFCHNCLVFAAPHTLTHWLTAENTECCRTQNSSHLAGRGICFNVYYKDMPQWMDSTVVTAGDGNQLNGGLQSRRTRHWESQVWQLDASMRIQVGIKVHLVRSKDAFCLMGDTPNDVRLEITHAALFIRKVKILPLAFIAYAQALQNSTAKYSIKRTVRNITQT